MNLKIYKNKDLLVDELARKISEIISDTLKNQEYFTLSLSGGETPQVLYKKLASPEFREKINWKRVHIFWGDERAVPFDDNRSNAKMAFDFLIDHINIPAAQVHKMRTDIEPVFAVTDYDKILHTYFDNTPKSFDLILLGMGDDGHTLSIFPGSSLIEDQGKKWVAAVYNEEQHMYRITLTPEIVNRSSNIIFIVTGSKKTNVLKQVIEGKYEPEKLPAQIIKPANGELYWFLDEDAAKELKDG